MRPECSSTTRKPPVTLPPSRRCSACWRSSPKTWSLNRKAPPQIAEGRHIHTSLAAKEGDEANLFSTVTQRAYQHQGAAGHPAKRPASYWRAFNSPPLIKAGSFLCGWEAGGSGRTEAPDFDSSPPDRQTERARPYLQEALTIRLVELPVRAREALGSVITEITSTNSCVSARATLGPLFLCPAP